MQQELATEKKIFRKKKTEQRNSLTAEERNEADKRLLEKLLLLPEYQRAKAVLTYVSARSEADTKALIAEALAAGKTVAVPKICEISVKDGEKSESDVPALKKEMRFYVISSLDELEEGYFGISEPKEGCPPFSFSDFLPEEIFLLIPGTAFDRTGARIGYGGGFYDRFLAEHLEIKWIALAYEMQMEEALPREEHDLCMDKIVTEKEIYDFCKIEEGNYRM